MSGQLPGMHALNSKPGAMKTLEEVYECGFKIKRTGGKQPIGV
jgi:hypothetical protein